MIKNIQAVTTLQHKEQHLHEDDSILMLRLKSTNQDIMRLSHQRLRVFYPRDILIFNINRRQSN